MNYRKLYMKIIVKAIDETQKGLRPKNHYYKKDFSQKFEFHHILPKSIFPNWERRQSNIIALTLKEHFFCHELLYKIYPNSNMFLSLWRLATDGEHIVSAKTYERLKSKYQISESHRQNIKKAMESVSKRPEWHQHISEGRAKQKNLAWGERDEIARKNISEGTKKAMNTPEMKKKLSERTKAAMTRPEVKEKLRENAKKFLGKSSKIRSEKYRIYKKNGGTLNWIEFLKQFKNLNLED